MYLVLLPVWKSRRQQLALGVLSSPGEAQEQSHSEKVVVRSQLWFTPILVPWVSDRGYIRPGGLCHILGTYILTSLIPQTMDYAVDPLFSHLPVIKGLGSSRSM